MSDPAYKIKISPVAAKTLGTLDKTIAKRIYEKLNFLAENVAIYPHAALKGKFKGLYSIHVGDYRAIYDIQHEFRLILIVKIGHRSNVYDL